MKFKVGDKVKVDGDFSENGYGVILGVDLNCEGFPYFVEFKYKSILNGLEKTRELWFNEHELSLLKEEDN